MAFINISTQKTITPISSPILSSGSFNIDALYQTEYINDLWELYPVSSFTKNIISEGLLVYITKGSKWIYDWSKDLAAPSYPEGTDYIRNEDYKKDLITTQEHKGEIWVLSDKNNINIPIYKLDILNLKGISTGLPIGWKRLLQDGDTTNTNLQWEQLK